MSLKRMPVTRSNALRGTGARTGTGRSRRRVSNVTRVRLSPPTARRQKSQILRNARTLARHSRMLRQQKVWTDWQFASNLFPTASGTWDVQRLTDFTAWNSVLRQDPVVSDKSHTFVLRLQLNMRLDLGDMDFCAFNVFIVTKRKNANQYDPWSVQPAINSEYVENSQQQGFNLRLNPAIYKVHFARYVTLTKNALFQAAQAGPAGDPRTTYRKLQVSLPVKMSVTKPATTGTGTGPWTTMHFENLPAYQQYFIMVHASWGGTGTINPSMVFDQLATCINSA